MTQKTTPKPGLVRDLLAGTGLAALSGGVGLQFGGPWALICVGALLLSAAVVSSVRGGGE